MESSVTVLRVRGIAIGIHWNWLLVFGIVVWSLARSLFPATYPGLDGSTYVAMAVVAALLFFGSILLHELGHALRAQREGIPIRRITLWLLGGVAHLEQLPPSPEAEFRVAIVGPATTAALAAAFGLAAWLGDRVNAPVAAQGVVDYVARINLVVLLFNLIPALPLDGGRVLRAWLWRREGSFIAATRSAGRASRVFGFMLVAVGLLNPFAGAGLGGIWLVFLGWFVLQAAQGENELADAGRALGLGRVGDVMTTRPAVLRSTQTVADLLDGPAGSPLSFPTYPVMDDGRLVGVASVRAAATVPPEAREFQSVSDVMIPLRDVRRCTPASRCSMSSPCSKVAMGGRLSPTATTGWWASCPGPMSRARWRVCAAGTQEAALAGPACSSG